MQSITLTEILIGLIPLLTISLSLIAYVKVYKNRQKKNQSNDILVEPKYNMSNGTHKPDQRALLLEDSVILVEDHEMPYELMMSLQPSDPVYIKYYDLYKPMIVVMYKHEVGYVLIPRDEEGQPRFYPFYKVFIGVPRQDFVTGFIRTKEGEDNVFIINGLVPKQKIVEDEVNAQYSDHHDYDISKEE